VPLMQLGGHELATDCINEDSSVRGAEEWNATKIAKQSHTCVVLSMRASQLHYAPRSSAGPALDPYEKIVFSSWFQKRYGLAKRMLLTVFTTNSLLPSLSQPRKKADEEELPLPPRRLPFPVHSAFPAYGSEPSRTTRYNQCK